MTVDLEKFQRDPFAELQEMHDHLVLLLAAIVDKTGGELSIPHAALEEVSGGLSVHNDGETYTLQIVPDEEES